MSTTNKKPINADDQDHELATKLARNFIVLAGIGENSWGRPDGFTTIDPSVNRIVVEVQILVLSSSYYNARIQPLCEENKFKPILLTWYR